MISTVAQQLVVVNITQMSVLHLLMS